MAIDFLKTSGDIIVNESNEKVLLQGFGLGGWLVLEGYMWNCYIEHASTSRMENAIEYLIGKEKKNEFFKTYRNNYITEKDIKYISDNNFNALRVPLHYRDFSPTFMEFSNEGFQLLDSLIVWGNRHNIYLILDNATVAPGFPFEVGGDIQSAPSVLSIDGEMIIFFGSKDDFLYSVNSSGSLRFSIKILNKPYRKRKEPLINPL